MFSMKLPLVEGGARIDVDSVRTDYDKEPFSFPGSWDVDSRICLQGQAPRPVTCMATVAEVTMSE